MKWEELKEAGSGHYRSGDVEPIDLYKSGGTLHDHAVSCIIKYAYRNRKEWVKDNISEKDMHKIIHYANILIALKPEEEHVSFDIIGKKAE